MLNNKRNGKADNEGKPEIMSDLARFSSGSQGEKRNEFMKDLMSENKFIADEMKMRAMVEEILKTEFSDSVKDMKSYDILVDAVVNKLKRDQSGDLSEIDDIE